MELKSGLKKIGGFITKYKYAALVVLIGVGLMMLPNSEKRNVQVLEKQMQHIVEEVTTEELLAGILRQTKGVGEVHILLTKGEGEETIFQTDTESTDSGAEVRRQSTTVTITDADRTQSGLIRQVNPARFLGAIVVCQGADDPQVRLQVIDAVSKATGLKSNCIAVLKMK